MAVSVTLSANAGISLCINDKKIWIDALHNNAVAGFSTVSPELLAQMSRHEAFRAPDVICCTHCHLDHYSKELVGRARQQWPQAELILPQREFSDQILVEGESMSVQAGGVELRFFALPHEDVKYEEVPHYGAVITVDGVSVLVTGDCEMASPKLAQQIQGLSLDLALIDFPWITLPKGREFIREHINSNHLLIYHLPFAEDDRWGYRAAAERCVKLLETEDIRLLYAPLQTELF